MAPSPSPLFLRLCNGGYDTHIGTRAVKLDRSMVFQLPIIFDNWPFIFYKNNASYYPCVNMIFTATTC